MPSVTPREAVDLGAVDSIFYSEYFFEKEVRQHSPDFHEDLWRLLEHPKNRFSNAEVFRGGAKTTIARLFGSKRIAYGISHTVLIIGPNQDHAAKSVEWLMAQVEYNNTWAQTFGLRKGKKWTSTECEILHEKFDYPIRIIAIGITGAVRGINIGGHRPDLIIVDDPCDEENTATPEARQKTINRFFGAIKESLVPTSEDPSASLILLQTPLHEDDLSAVCMKSPEFASLRIGILTEENEDRAESAWPSRWSKQEILAEKEAAIARNQLSLWMREKMCLIIARETSTFLTEWLEYWEVLPATARYVMGVDPAPIKSEKARLTGQKTDEQAVMVKAYHGANSYVVEYSTSEDEDPEALCINMNRLARKYNILRCGVEGVAYQRMLKWYIEQQIKKKILKAMYIVELPAIGSKYDRIRQAHLGPASNGQLHVHASHTQFIEQFAGFPNIKYKDLLDVSAICDGTIAPSQYGSALPDGAADMIDESHIPDLDWERAV